MSLMNFKNGRGLRPFGLGFVAGCTAVLFLLGCASSGGKASDRKARKGTPSSVKVEPAGDLSDLNKAIKTREDAMILDLLLSYRMLLISNQDAKSLDKETLKLGRQAFEHLETLLRHGGIKAQDVGERVYKVTGEARLSLQEVIQSAAIAAEKNVRDGDWENAQARWTEIVQAKASIAFIMEEAQWGLTLAAALKSAIPDSTKKKLKELNESYAADINSEEIGKQVKVLLEEVKDVKLQRELKKLANRAWEKDKRAGRATNAKTVQTVPPEIMVPGPDTVKTPPTPAPVTAVASPNGAVLPAPQPPIPAVNPEAANLGAQVDTLASMGKYVAALKLLDKAGEQTWVKEKKSQIGNQFCEEKRRSAANAFKEFKKTTVDSLKRIQLKRTATDLDSCLFYFPDLVISQKVRKNREMVETELKKLKP